jgi:hypothetical protein
LSCGIDAFELMRRLETGSQKEAGPSRSRQPKSESAMQASVSDGHDPNRVPHTSMVMRPSTTVTG